MVKRTILILLSLIWLVSCENSPQPERKIVQRKEDLKNITIGVLLGSVQDKYASDSLKDCQVMRLENLADVFTALRNDMCDVVFSDYSNFLDASLTDPGITNAIDDLWGVSPCGMAFNKKDPDLLDQFNRFLRNIRQNGLYDEIYNRWITNYTPENTIPELPSVNGEPLIFGVGGVMPHYAYVKDGVWQGIDIEIATRFAHSINRPLEIKDISFSGLISALAVGKVDFIGGCICITEERSKQVNFSDPVTLERCVVSRYNHDATQKPFEEQNWNDFIDGKKVGVLIGSSQDLFLSENAQNVELIRFDDHATLSQGLLSDQCDVIIEMDVVGNFLTQNTPKFSIFPDTLFVDSVGVGFRKQDTLLCHQFNTFLAELKQTPTFQEMKDRWLQQGKIGDPVEIELPETGKPLRVGVKDELVGFTYIKEGEVVGLEPELARRFAQYLNRPIEFMCLNFTSLMPSLLSNKVDMIISTITITPERKKSILFSDIYYQNEIIPIYKKNDLIYQKNAFEVVKESFHNNVILENRYKLILEGLYETLFISLFAIILGTLLGCGICYMRMSKNTLINSIASVYISIMRGVPLLVLLMIMFYVIFAASNISPTTVAIITFAMNFAAYVSEMFRTGIESVDRGQTEAGIALGFSKFRAFQFIVVPQAFRQVMPVYKGEVISLIKSTSIVGYIAIHDLTKASDIIRSRTFDAFFPLILISIIYFILAWLCVKLLDYLFTKAISAKI